MAKWVKRHINHLIHWRDRDGAIEFIKRKMDQGESFDSAFRQMEKVAIRKGFIRKNTTFELMSSGAYTRLKNDCRREQNEGA